MRKIRIIGVPLDLGQERRGVDMGPSALRVADLNARLRAKQSEPRQSWSGHPASVQGERFTRAAADEKMNAKGLEVVVADKGYHSGAMVEDWREIGVRSYISEPQRGRRHWQGQRGEPAAVYDNRRRLRGERGKQLLRRRGELLERTFAHVYDTGGMRRTHLRGHRNILKRLLLHVAAFNLSLILRRERSLGTPRGVQDLRHRVLFCWLLVWVVLENLRERDDRRQEPSAGGPWFLSLPHPIRSGT